MSICYRNVNCWLTYITFSLPLLYGLVTTGGSTLSPPRSWSDRNTGSSQCSHSPLPFTLNQFIVMQFFFINLIFILFIWYYSLSFSSKCQYVMEMWSLGLTYIIFSLPLFFGLATTGGPRLSPPRSWSNRILWISPLSPCRLSPREGVREWVPWVEGGPEGAPSSPSVECWTCGVGTGLCGILK